MKEAGKIVYVRCPYCFHTAKADNYWIIEPVGCETNTNSAQTKEV